MKSLSNQLKSTSSKSKMNLDAIDEIVVSTPECMPATERLPVCSETNKKIGQLWSEMFSCVALAEQNEACVEELLEGLRSLKRRILDKASSKTPKDKNKELQLLVGCEILENITILPPRQSKNKGSGERMRSKQEQAAEQHKKAPRMCKACGQRGYHDSRNCPNMKEKSETGSDSESNNSSSS